MTDQLDTERQRQANIELANAYREMMGTFAWKHLTGTVLPRIAADAMRIVDDTPIEELTIAHVAEVRGVRKCLDKLNAEVVWILNSHEAIKR